MNRKIFLTLNLLTILQLGLSQDRVNKNEKTCDDCKIDCLCDHFLGNYRMEVDQIKINTIKSNWNDFFAEDLEEKFPSPQNVPVVSIKFDGMGCVYPTDIPLNDIKDQFLDPHVSYKKFHQSTFYNIFNKFQKKEVTDPEVRQFIDRSLSNTQFNKINQDIEYFDFVKKWNEKFIPSKVLELNNKIKGNEIKRIIFYIHGYNVPYGLAHVQSNLLLDSILSINKELKPNNILFVRVFWPSGNYKSKNIDATNCDYDNFENWKTASAFTYFSNRAYMAALYFRRVLREFSSGQIPIDIVTHSHGATVATTALINTLSKLERGDKSEAISLLLKAESLPNKKISVFLNAPSIPGVNTFSDIDENSVQNGYRFFVGYNNDDIVLAKRKFHVGKLKIRFISPARHLSSTSLGCNRNGEVHATQRVFIEKHIPDNFISGVNSFQQQHDFFCYINQLEFNRNLSTFLNYPQR